MSAKRNRATVPPNRAWPFSAQDITPLAWWRTLPYDLLRDAEKLLLRATLGRIEVLHGANAFRGALQGDAAAAIAVAFALTPVEHLTLEVDIAMTALLLCAAEGNSAAALVLANIVSRTEFDHNHATELSASWYAQHLDRSPHQRSFNAEETELLAALRERYAEVDRGEHA
jgi:hypothetical protein